MAKEEKTKKSKEEISKEMAIAYSKFKTGETNVIIEKIPYDASKESLFGPTVRNLNPKVPDLLTLPEASDLFGQKSNRKKKVKIVNLSGIDRTLIPASLHGLFDVPNEEVKDKESHEADTN